MTPAEKIDWYRLVETFGGDTKAAIAYVNDPKTWERMWERMADHKVPDAELDATANGAADEVKP